MPTSPRASWLALLRFGLVGTLGYGLDTLVLLLTLPVLGPVLGRCVSLLSSMLLTWVLNRRYTFERRPRLSRTHQEALAYFACMAVGAVINFGVYLLAGRYLPAALAYPALCVALGSLAGLGFNFLAARHLLESGDPPSRSLPRV